MPFFSRQTLETSNLLLVITGKIAGQIDLQKKYLFERTYNQRNKAVPEM